MKKLTLTRPVTNCTPAVLLIASMLFATPACSLGSPNRTESASLATPTVVVAQFSTPEPTVTSHPSPTPDLSYLLTPTATPAPSPTGEASATPEPPSPTPEATKTNSDVPPEPPPAEAIEPEADFVVRLVRMRTNEENSWDGVLNGICGSDHSIYVHVVDAEENLLDGILVGDKYGNFEVPTGVDGPGTVRILVWSATMEVAVMGRQDGARFTGEFSPPLSTLDEDIPLDWLQQGGYCHSPEDCRQRVESNQLCRGHYSYDVVFQRTK